MVIFNNQVFESTDDPFIVQGWIEMLSEAKNSEEELNHEYVDHVVESSEYPKHSPRKPNGPDEEHYQYGEEEDREAGYEVLAVVYNIES